MCERRTATGQTARWVAVVVTRGPKGFEQSSITFKKAKP